MMEEEVHRIMVVMAHPDDAEFTCGGSVAEWSRDGKEVIYVICTNGDKGSDDPTMTSERLAEIREQEQREAARTLGVQEVVFLGHPDGGLEDTHAFRGEIVRLLRRYRPQRVVTQDPYRRSRYFVHHRDHRITGTVTLDAIYPYARDRLHYPEHIAAGLLPHRVEEVYLSGADEPDVWVDISEVFEQKVTALRCHRSQVGQAPLEDFRERVRRMGATVGEPVGLLLAEAFARIILRR